MNDKLETKREATEWIETTLAGAIAEVWDFLKGKASVVDIEAELPENEEGFQWRVRQQDDQICVFAAKGRAEMIDGRIFKRDGTVKKVLTDSASEIPEEGKPVEVFKSMEIAKKIVEGELGGVLHEAIAGSFKDISVEVESLPYIYSESDIAVIPFTLRVTSEGCDGLLTADHAVIRKIRFSASEKGYSMDVVGIGGDDFLLSLSKERFIELAVKYNIDGVTKKTAQAAGNATKVEE